MPLMPQDREAFAAMLSAVAEIYGKALTPQLIAIYWQALAPYDLAAVRKALDMHVRNPDTGQYWPKPADVIRMLGGTTEDAALQAWATAERAIRRIGGYESVVFDDPLIHRCIEDMGGWQKLCETLEEELPFRAREFSARYRGYAMRRDIPQYPSHLIGRFEADNSARGYDAPAPVLIGDPDACRRVLEAGGGDRLRVARRAGAAAAIAHA